MSVVDDEQKQNLMISWYHLINRKVVPFKNSDIASNSLAFIKEAKKHFSQRHNKFIRRSYFKDCDVSTVFLGLDHGYHTDKPIVFETMIFGGKHEEYQTRCCTHREALAMHWQAVKLIKEQQQ